MQVEQRHGAILKMLNRKRSVTNRELREKFAISYDSVKRDLRILEEKGLLKRVHGGAVLARVACGETVHEASEKEQRLLCVKEIAACAVEEIRPREVVYVMDDDIGTAMAACMPRDQICTVVTNSVAAAEKFKKKENITLIFAGENKIDSEVSGGEISLEMLRNLHFDKCFIVFDKISAVRGLTFSVSDHAELLRTVARNSRKIYGLCEASKIREDSDGNGCNIVPFDVLITDCKNEEILQALREAGMEVMVPHGKTAKNIF